ncbi:hypothetical protein GCM10027614_68230 [Micromonospora vulcania]
MDGDTRYTIGELARRTGLTVKAIRFYSDRGIAPPTDRSPAGYRRYDAEAVTRLELVRTLRELGVDLATIRRVVEHEVPLAEVAATHAEALAVQIRVLRLRRAVLSVAARRRSGAAEVDDLHRLAQLSAEQREHLVGDFLDTVFAGLRDQPTYPGIVVSMTPELPDEPTAEQVEAWLELAELCRDPGFRASMRRLAQQHAADHDVPGYPARTPSRSSGTRWPLPWPPVSIRPLPRRTRWSLPSPAGTPSSAACPTTPPCADGCWIGSPWRTTRAGTVISTCSRCSTAGRPAAG